MRRKPATFPTSRSSARTDSSWRGVFWDSICRDGWCRVAILAEFAIFQPTTQPTNTVFLHDFRVFAADTVTNERMVSDPAIAPLPSIAQKLIVRLPHKSEVVGTSRAGCNGTRYRVST